MKWLLALIALATCVPAAAQAENDMLIIAHRGASGERPEHTLAAYELAIDQGADYIEPDLVATRDGVLVARHENEISGTTDVDQRPEFATRLTTKAIDGREVTGWFTEDFTLAELRTLRARERLPEIRPQNARFDGLYLVPTLEEIILLVRAKEAETGRTIGLYPEIKHPGYFRSIGHDLAAMLVEQLRDAGYKDAGAPVFIQSFEAAPLRRLDTMTDLRLVQLIEADGTSADDPPVRYADMVTADGLAAIAEYADGIGVDLRLVMTMEEAVGSLASRAHEAGLLIHGWTVRRENEFLPYPFATDRRQPRQTGCLARLWDALGAQQLDGIFTDNPREFVELRGGAERSDDCVYPSRLPPLR